MSGSALFVSTLISIREKMNLSKSETGRPYSRNYRDVQIFIRYIHYSVSFLGKKQHLSQGTCVAQALASL